MIPDQQQGREGKIAFFTWEDYIDLCSAKITKKNLLDGAGDINGSIVYWNGIVKQKTDKILTVTMKINGEDLSEYDINLNAPLAIQNSYGSEIQVGKQLKFVANINIRGVKPLTLPSQTGELVYNLANKDIKERADLTLTFGIFASYLLEGEQSSPDIYFNDLFKGRKVSLIGLIIGVEKLPKIEETPAFAYINFSPYQRKGDDAKYNQEEVVLKLEDIEDETNSKILMRCEEAVKSQNFKRVYEFICQFEERGDLQKQKTSHLLKIIEMSYPLPVPKK
ncbi:MAG: hypothetical protein EZS28_001909 [Streblomastix strix]|uniref:Uncharacterized protein n=1 Tax=Streblomastix strix TaxID=222440 RepID=A0A5J4X5V1_9EUKA|nr:MAG: hypothetical protein EZS28_001909 [Streblomastix strix]